MSVTHERELYGLMAEFDNPTELVRATRLAYLAGYRAMDAYSPFPIEEATEALGVHDTHVPLAVLLGGCLGGTLAFLLQYWISVDSFPINVAGRPLDSWPSFIVVTFEMTVLGGAFGGFFGMLARNGFPKPYHPVFNARHFDRASQDGFFLCIECRDELFHREKTETFLKSLNPVTVEEVAC